MNATTFPISLTWHLTFCALACIFFVVQYVRTKKSYQLLLAIGIPASLIIYINPENVSLFYSVGVFEAVLLVGAVVFAFIERSRRKQEEEDTAPLPDKAEEVRQTPEEPENDDTEETQKEPAADAEPEDEEA